MQHQRKGQAIFDYGWNDHGQLASVKSLAGAFVYGYDESNPVLLTKMTGPAYEVETSYEPHRNLITGVVNRSRFAAEVGGRKSEVGGDAGAPVAPAPAAGSGPSTKDQALRTLSSYTYTNDLLGRRETISQGGEAFRMLALGENCVEVAYNNRSEVVGAVTRRGDIPVARHTYAFDAIGNRQRAASEVGGRKSEVSYEVNTLNQYTTIQTTPAASAGSGQRTTDQGPSIPRHDADGNLIEDARNRYTWNADNNLIRVESKGGTSRIDYVYDHQSRRTVRRTYARAAATENWTLKTENFYLYDDWNLVADVSAVTGHGSEVTGEETDAVRYYTWGRDVSGSLQGAGGVGGLLAIGKGASHRFPTYDANGNIGQLIDGAGAFVAAYAYDPFANVTEMAGAEAAENEWRFSTKPVEVGTGWLYYGYRWYDAGMGRWVNRDPIEESGGVNLYGFVGGSPINEFDYLGKLFGPVIFFGELALGSVVTKAAIEMNQCSDDVKFGPEMGKCVECVSRWSGVGETALAGQAVLLYAGCVTMFGGHPGSWLGCMIPISSAFIFAIEVRRDSTCRAYQACFNCKENTFSHENFCKKSSPVSNPF